MPFAAPARFETALATSDEWEGEWITYQSGHGDTNGWRTDWTVDAERDE